MPTHCHAQRPRDHEGDDLESAAALVTAAHAQLAHARRSLRRALDARANRPGRQPGQCGTPAGYRRHQRAHETPCVACVEAWSWDHDRRLTRWAA